MADVTYHPAYSGKGYTTIEAQGSLFAIAKRTDAEIRPGGGVRGLVTKFSYASRNRLLRKIARLEPVKTTFITLTYPYEMRNHEQAKIHLKTLLERFRRAFPEMAAIWRMEYQASGSIHFHLLCFDMPFYPFKDLKEAWRDIIKWPEAAGPLMVRIEAIRSWRGVMRYAAKYLAKPGNDEGGITLLDCNAYPHAGRFWGIHNKNAMPYAARSIITIRLETGRGFYNVKRVMRRFWPDLTDNRARGGVIFTDSAQKLWSHALMLMIPDITDEFFATDAILLRTH